MERACVCVCVCVLSILTAIFSLIFLEVSYIGTPCGLLLKSKIYFGLCRKHLKRIMNNV